MKNDSVAVAAHSVGAILRIGAERFLFQLRDDKPEIVMPGCWGFFGGEVDAGESYERAIVRELDEELGLVGRAPIFATEFAIPRPRGWMRRKLFEVRLSDADVAALTLREGAAMRVMTALEFLALPNIVYWDALGLAYVLQEKKQ